MKDTQVYSSYHYQSGKVECIFLIIVSVNSPNKLRDQLTQLSLQHILNIVYIVVTTGHWAILD